MSCSHLQKLRLWLIAFCLLIPFALLYAERPNIVDTIYTENSLQASVSIVMETNFYYAEIVHTGFPYLNPGDFLLSDWINGEPDTNLGVRYYLSFSLQPIPTDYAIESVGFKLFQFNCSGDGFDNVFPIFYGNHYDLNVDHVDYGNSIEVSDFNPINYGTAGAICTDNTYGWKQLDITDEYQIDLNSNRQYCQLMIYFPVISDWDFRDDFVYFRSSYHIAPEGKPQIVITYQPINSTTDNIITPNPRVSVYPNPCKDFATISAKDNSTLVEIQLYNLKGQKLNIANRVSNNKNEACLEFEKDIKPGIYILKYSASSSGKVYTGTKKLLIR